MLAISVNYILATATTQAPCTTWRNIYERVASSRYLTNFQILPQKSGVIRSPTFPSSAGIKA